jgi:two-component system, OmpR family, sensor kinase
LLQRALSNLLSNALRYCQSKVWIELTQQGSDCLIDICDDGAGWQQELPVASRHPSHGTPPQSINHDANSAASLPRSDGVSHHGIGLAIVARVAHQHGGEFIRLDRREGGAIARLRLPIGSEKEAEQPL